MRICKVVLGQLQDDGNQNEELSRNLPHIAMENPYLFPILFNDLVLTNVFPCPDIFVDVELLFVSLISRSNMGNLYHLNVFLDASIANPALVLPVPEVLAFCKIARKSPLLFKRLPEECITDTELA